MRTYCEFFIPLKKVPTITHQMKRVTVVNGKPRFYENSKLAETRIMLMSRLIQHRPSEMITQGVRLTVKWCFNHTKKSKHGEYKLTKPDTDNLNKLLKDCMTDCQYWKDDSLVASEIIEKFYSDTPGIYIKIDSLQ